MNTNVNQLLEADREARTILDNARQYYDQTMEELIKEKQELTDRFEEKARSHIDNVLSSEKSSSADKITAIERYYAALSDNIGDICEQNRQKWEDELFLRCVGR